MNTEIITSVSDMQSISNKLKGSNHKLRLVPTMGALHDGHSSLIRAAINHDSCHTQGDAVSKQHHNTSIVVSIFLNRKQFNNQDDYDGYPNSLEADLKMCRDLGVNYVFLPSNDEMYPPGRINNDCSIEPPSNIGRDLEGSARPGHFRGMLTCVCKLFNITKPTEAFFGEKDYQQLVLVSMMVQDLNMDIKVIPVKTVRESDLLPLSSRNVRLDPNARRIAPLINQILIDAKHALKNLHDSHYVKTSKTNSIDLDIFLIAAANATMCLQLDQYLNSRFDISYIAVRCADDFRQITYDTELGMFYRKSVDTKKPNTPEHLQCRLLIAATVGGIRLLDNIEIVLNNCKT